VAILRIFLWIHQILDAVGDVFEIVDGYFLLHTLAYFDVVGIENRKGII